MLIIKIIYTLTRRKQIKLVLGRETVGEGSKEEQRGEPEGCGGAGVNRGSAQGQLSTGQPRASHITLLPSYR